MSPGLGLFVITAVIIGLVALVIISDNKRREEWAKFNLYHHCKVIHKTDSTTSLGVGYASSSKGGGVAVVPVTNPAMTSYLCDDGITYTKEY